MNNELIIAAAGSGKTRTIVSRALAVCDENVLITTYTEANAAGIKNKIIKETGGYIPQNITVQTWFSFLLQHGVRPFQTVMNDYLWDKQIGFLLVNGSSSIRTAKNGKPYSVGEKDFFLYYFVSQNNLKMFSDKVSEFIFKCNQKVGCEVIKRISKIYPHIFIDEVQDLAGYDLDLLLELFNTNSKILLVGDPRQATYSTHSSRKNKKFQKSNITNFFEDNRIASNLEIDDKSLTTNYRCNENITNFSNTLFSNFPPAKSNKKSPSGHDGIFLVKLKDVNRYLREYPDCTQLRWNMRTKVHPHYPVLNYGDAKGLDFKRVLLYPTGTIADWLKNNDSQLATTTRSKLYVALTRAEYSLAIVYDFKDDEEFEYAAKF